jgi:RNA polymerase sigma-70 factor (ECF subfamily)
MPAGNAEGDAQLISRLRQGDEQAFLMLYDRHQRSVYRFLMHMTGSIAIAEELTQEVFFVILNAMCSGTVSLFNSEKGTLEGYLLGIARNFAREEHRRSRRLLSLDTVLESPEWSQFLNKVSQDNRAWDASEQLAARSEMKVLYSAILELPSHYREVVVLCSLQEKSYQEAAAILQCSEGTIASRLNRAKTLLAAKLQRLARDEVNTAAT